MIGLLGSTNYRFHLETDDATSTTERLLVNASQEILTLVMAVLDEAEETAIRINDGCV